MDMACCMLYILFVVILSLIFETKHTRNNRGRCVCANVHMRHAHGLWLLLFNDIYKVLGFKLYPGSVNGVRLTEFMYEKMYNIIQSYPT